MSEQERQEPIRGLDGPERQLHQVKWSQGQADSSLNPETVRRLLNVELDQPGELRPRDQVDTPSIVEADVLAIFRMKADPVGSSPDGWVFKLKAATLEVWRAGGTVPYTTLSIPLGAAPAVSGLSEMAIRGSTGVLAAVRDGGTPIDTFLVSYVDGRTRFQPPDHAYGMGTATPQTLGGYWTILAMDRVVPELISREFKDKREYTSMGRVGDQNHINNLVGIVEGDVTDAGHEAVVMVWCYDLENPRHPTFTEPTTAEYRIQFKYADGSTSSLSNPVSVPVAGLWNTNNKVAFTLAVHKDLSLSVSEINVFRGLVSGSTPPNMELIQVAKIDNSAEEEYQAAGCSWPERELEDAWPSDGNPNHPFQEYAPPRARMVYGVVAQDGLVKIVATNGTFDSPEMVTLTSGWRLIGVNAFLYYAPHYSFSGELKFRWDSPEGWGTGVWKYAEWVVAASGLAPMVNTGGQETCRIHGGVRLSLPSISFTAGNPLSMQVNDAPGWGDFSPIWWCRGLASTTGLVSAIGLNGGGGSVAGTGAFIDRDTDRIIALWSDWGLAGLLDYASVEGVLDNERVKIKARHVAFAMGRLLCLGVGWEHDGEQNDYLSRLVWSEFGKLASFGITNYNEYGNADDGKGVGIAVHGTSLVILGTAFVSALDISGGSDMAWREIGSWGDLGCLNSRAYCETPFGVVFCDRTKAYLWDGQQMQCITEDPQRGLSIRATYSQYADSLDGVFFRPSMHQVWVVSGTKALVYDITRSAWHEHEFTEVDSGLKILGIGERENDEFLDMQADANLVSAVLNPEPATSLFGWGLDTGPMTMGVPEIEKKLKRVYVHTEPEGTGGTFRIRTNGGAWSTVNNPGSRINRISQSARGHDLRVEVEIQEATSWRGKVKSLGASFKPKRLK